MSYRDAWMQFARENWERASRLPREDREARAYSDHIALGHLINLVGDLIKAAPLALESSPAQPSASPVAQEAGCAHLHTRNLEAPSGDPDWDTPRQYCRDCGALWFKDGSKAQIVLSPQPSPKVNDCGEKTLAVSEGD